MSKDEIVDNFNDTLLDMLKEVASIAPNTQVGRNIDAIEDTFKKLKFPNKRKFIDNFVLKVLKYQDEIEAEEEEYFFNELEKKEVKNDNDVKSVDIGELVHIWKKFKADDKKTIFAYLKVLCNYCNDYLLA